LSKLQASSFKPQALVAGGPAGSLLQTATFYSLHLAASPYSFQNFRIMVIDSGL
jgi:hypothetical protein